METQQIISRIRNNLNVCSDELYEISKLFNKDIETPFNENKSIKSLEERLKLWAKYAEIIVNKLIKKDCLSEKLKNKVYRILIPIINDIIFDIRNFGNPEELNNLSRFDLIIYALIGREIKWIKFIFALRNS